MRWESSEIGASGPRRRPRRGEARKSQLRKAALERLEERALMAVLPTPTSVGPVLVSSTNSQTSNESTPSIAIDQNNPNHLVAVWTRHETDVTNPPFIDVEGAFSINGGQTWTTFNPSDFLLNPNTTNPTVPYTRVTEASIAFDRNSNFYVLTKHDTAQTSGALALSKFSFTGNAPTVVFRDRVVYQWVPASDQAVNPMLAVDDSPAVFTDPDTGATQNNPHSGNVYIAFATVDVAPAGNPLGNNFNPNRIRLIASSDGGATFSGQAVINDSSNFGTQRNARPRLAISGGTIDGRIAPGQVTVVWDDFGTGATAPTPFDILWSDRLTPATSATVNAAVPVTINDAADPGNSQPHIPAVTNISVPVNITDPRFTTLNDLVLSLSLVHPTLAELRIELVPPAGSGLPTVTLLNNQLDASGNTISPNIGATGANLGVLNGFSVPTIFDDRATRNIVDIDPATGNRGAAAPFNGSFQPEGARFGQGLSQYNGATLAQINGTWTIRITDFRSAGTTPPVQFVQAARLSLTSGLDGLDSGTNGSVDRPINTTFVRGTTGDVFSRATAATAKGIGPGLTVAQDNTLGSFSPFQGRIYAAYVDRIDTVDNPADNTDIFLVYSDDGGLSWSNRILVNDDEARIDGFSESDTLSGVRSGRPQFQPNVTVDQATGTLVMSWYDTRHDAAEARVATYLGASIDGGNTFSKQIFVNNARVAIDAITGQPVNLGPIPDNQSAGNPSTEATFGYGDRQGLIAYAGRAYPIWASNLNGDNSVNDPDNNGTNNGSSGVNADARLDIRAARVAYAAGPRVVDSTMGVVGLTDQFGNVIDPVNNQRASDGTPIIAGFEIVFDRPVAPGTFRPDDVSVFFRDATPGNVSGGPVPVIDVVPQGPQATDTQGNPIGYTRFRVVVAPRSAVGTYSYAVGPDINDRIRRVVNNTLVVGNRMDQNANAVTNEAAAVGVGLGDVYAAPRPTSTGGSFQIGAGGFFAGPYDPDTLPLILPGPRLVSSNVPGAPVSADNLSQDRPVTGIDVTFDRDMSILSFTGTDVLRIQGPAGELIRPTTFTPVASQQNLPIPDAPGGPLISTMTLTDDGTFRVGDIDVILNITQPRDSDLAVTLIAPDGTRVPLFSGIGGTGANFTNTVLDDQADVPIGAGSAPFTGRFRPISALSALVGKELRGDWKLEVKDNAGGGGAGTLVNWSLAVTPLPQVAAVYNSNTGAVAIPDNGQLSSLLTVPDDGGIFQIADLNVTLDITHPRPTDLVVELVAPDGTVVPLMANIGGTLNPNVRGLTLDDQASVPVNRVPAPFTGVYRPQGGSLAALNGKELRGVWQLRVTDTVTGSSGVLNYWSLTATPTSGAATARTFRVSFPTQVVGGDYAMTVAPSLLSRNGDALDQNQNAGLDLLKGTAQAAPSVPVVYNSVDVPKPLPDVQTVTSRLTVPDSFLIADLNVTLNITHTNDPDLTATLIAPDGTRILLFDRVGAVGPIGTRRNFTQTTLDDQASTPITSGAAPFFGTFQPQGDINGTLSTLNGRNAAGTWTLEIVDNTPGNTGTLNSWSLTFRKPVPNTGLGEPVTDRAQVTFRIFNMDPANPLSSNVWTPVGPAGITENPNNRNGYSGRVSAIAVDPSDPSGNTVYIGAASGGVWKTTNFLTTDFDGPTWIPLTDFGPTFGLNIGSIAIFGRNNDPNQSIIFATTGEGAAGFGFGSTNNPGANGSTTRGLGLLRSLDGGATWALLDSTDNTLPFAQRDHRFSANGGTTSFRVVVDPTPTLTGDVIVYAALSGPAGGLWRSLDTGRTWELMRAGNATDVVLDLNSKSADRRDPVTNLPAGNVDIIHAAFQGDGVYISPNRGQTFNLMTGQVGVPQLRDGQVGPSPAIPVSNLPSPNGGFGRIVLAKPEPLAASAAGSAVRNLLYEGWLYAAVANTNGTFQGLYLTKDNGQTWTQIQLPYVPWPYTGRPARASNDATRPDYDVVASPTFQTGNYNLSLTIDPNNPHIVYLGGTSVGQESGLIRIDTTTLRDAHAMIGYDDTLPDGGALTLNTLGGGPAVIKTNDDGLPAIFQEQVGGGFTFDFLRRQFVNLLQDPNQPFIVGSTVYLYNVASFGNDGSGVKWIPYDQMLLATPGNFNPSTNIHQLVTIRDPLTGRARLLAADDQGIFTGLDDGTGQLDRGVGNLAAPTFSRVGNLQISQFYRGAAQPSTLTAELAGAMFYGMSQGNGYPASDPNVLDNGQTAWLGLTEGELDGSDVATSQEPLLDANGQRVLDPVTGLPVGRGLVYQYKWPGLSNDPSFTNFFQVNGVSRTRGLLQGPNDPQWPTIGPVYDGLIPMGRFAVNPLNGDQIVISSNAGRIFGTTNQGAQWQVIGNPGDLDGTYAPAVVFGAPDPAAPGGIGNLGNFIYAGTIGGNIFVTRTGGGGAANAWQNIGNTSNGLDGSSVVEIVTSPDRGSHAAYAITLRGVYYNPDTLAAGATWRNITGNLFSILQSPFGDASAAQPKLSFLTSIRADWRYAIPDDLNDPNSPIHPVLYVSGDSGVYRSFDNGRSWSLFPATVDGALVDGGYLPNVHITDLDLSLGLIDPTNGRPIINASSPNVLLASTFGRGSFAIRLAPQVFGDLLRFADGSDSGSSATDRITNVVTPTIEGLSAQTAFGSVITVQLIDLSDPANPVVIGTGTTDENGRFSITVDAGHFLSDGSTDGVKTIGVQAVDQAGTRGNMALFVFTLDTVAPQAPDTPDLDALSDSGILDNDNITNVTNPVLHVAAGTDEANPTVITLLRNGQPVGTRTATNNDANDTIQDPGPVQPDGVYQYRARRVDLAGNTSTLSGALLVTIDTTPPARPAAPVLLPADDSGAKGDNTTNNQRPRLTGTTEPNATVELIDLANTVLATTTADAAGAYTIQPDSDLTAGTYTLRVRAIDVAGNASTPSPTLDLTIITGPLGAVTIQMVLNDDSGIPGDRRTNVNPPRFTGTATPGLTVELLDVTDPNNPILLTATPAVVATDGTWLLRPDSPFTPDGPRTIQARVRDVADNTGLSPVLDIFIDTTAPDTRPTLALRDQDDTGRKGDNTTVRRRPVFVGTAEPGATVELVQVNTDGSLGPVLATGTASPTGSYTLQLASNLTNGTIRIQARVRDIAGNTGPLSDSNPATPNVADPLTVTITSVLDDFDNDGRADPATFNPATGLWTIIQSTNGRRAEIFGQTGDIPLRGDFDGDGKADLGVYRPGTSQFILNRSTAGAFSLAFGDGPTAIPVAGDFDGDGKTDIAVFDPNSGYWFILRSRDGAVARLFGQAGDVPAAGDYDGDGKTDLAVYRPSTATFLVRLSSNGTDRALTFGRAGGVDTPIPGDYNGDGRTDVAVYWPDFARYVYAFTAADGTLGGLGAGSLVFGRVNADVPVVDDYDGDGKTDVAAYWPDNTGRTPDSGLFLISYSSGGAAIITPNAGVTRELPLQAPTTYLKANRLGSTGTLRTAAFSAATNATTGSTGGSATSSLDFGKTAATLAVTPTAALQAPAAESSTNVVTNQAETPKKRGLAAIRRSLARHRAAARRFGR
jgi:subtilisin-like proprotein convertase family protein